MNAFKSRLQALETASLNCLKCFYLFISMFTQFNQLSLYSNRLTFIVSLMILVQGSLETEVLTPLK